MTSIRAIDSHTGGEPTRVVLEGSIPLVGATMMERREDFRARFDHLRSGLVLEPRGSDVLVGAVLTEPVSPEATIGVIFFNAVSYLGMCGHGTIGVVETLRHLGRIEPGHIFIDTPVGLVEATLHQSGDVSIRNIESRRFLADVHIHVEGIGEVVGDVGYGGNWFFIVHSPLFDVRLSEQATLIAQTIAIRRALADAGITGADGAEIDHVELEGVEHSEESDSRNFVLCPGVAYDRSPCGTGTSAKVACLHAAEKLVAGAEFVQESVTGSIFRATVVPTQGGVLPTITGRAHVIGDAQWFFDDDDPLRWGLR